MVAAHAWDLRAAAAAGMGTAFIPRPHGDDPARSDTIGYTAGPLPELRDQLRA